MPEGADRNAGLRSHQGPAVSPPVASGASLPAAWQSHHCRAARCSPDGSRSASRCRYARRADEARRPWPSARRTAGGPHVRSSTSIAAVARADPTARSRRASSRRASPRCSPRSARGPISCPRSGSCSGRGLAASPTTWRTPSRSRSRTCPAGQPRRRPDTPADSCWATSAAGPWSCSRAGSTCTRATTPGLVVQPVLLFHALGATDRHPDQRRRRARSDVRAGHADGHARSHRPDRPLAADGPERRLDGGSLHRT